MTLKFREFPILAIRGHLIFCEFSTDLECFRKLRSSAKFREHLNFANLADSGIYAKIKCSRKFSVIQYTYNA